MNALTRLLALALVVLVSSACANKPESAQTSPVSTFTPDADAVKLVTLGEQAMQRVRKETPDVVLHQIDTDLNKTYFRFTDEAATKEISVLVSAADVPPEQWIIEVNPHTPLIGNTDPGLNLRKLRVGPHRVIQAISAQWLGCTIRSLTLYSEKGNLTWLSDCNTSAGVVAGTMDGETGIFRPSDALPALLPVTATPFR